MPLDPNIPLQAQAPKVESPFQTMGQILSIQGAQQQIAAQRQEAQVRAMQIQQGQKAQQDDQTFRTVLAQHTNSDANTFDVVGATTALRKLGLEPQATQVQAQYDTHFRNTLEASQTQMQLHANRLDQTSAALQGVTDQASLDRARPRVKELWKDEDPDGTYVDAMLPTTYDAAKVKFAKDTTGTLQGSATLQSIALNKARELRSQDQDAAQMTTIVTSMADALVGSIHEAPGLPSGQKQFDAVWGVMNQIPQGTPEDQQIVARVKALYGDKWTPAMSEQAGLRALGPAKVKAEQMATSREMLAAQKTVDAEFKRELEKINALAAKRVPNTDQATFQAMPMVPETPWETIQQMLKDADEEHVSGLEDAGFKIPDDDPRRSMAQRNTAATPAAEELRNFSKKNLGGKVAAPDLAKGPGGTPPQGPPAGGNTLGIPPPPPMPVVRAGQTGFDWTNKDDMASLTAFAKGVIGFTNEHLKKTGKPEKYLQDDDAAIVKFLRQLVADRTIPAIAGLPQ